MTEPLGIIRQEILQGADALAREKGIDPSEVIEALEQAIQKAGRAKYGLEQDIRAFINRKTGEIRLARYRTVAEDPQDLHSEVSLADAQALDPENKIGDLVSEPLPPIDFGRVAAQTVKQVIVQRVRQAERLRQYLEYKDRVGEIINGVVKRVEYGNITVDLGRVEALLKREELIPRESFRTGDRIRAYLMDARQEPRGPQVFLSRTHPDFMAKLFTQEVPEIYDGIIEIKIVARDPGSRAKMAVYSKDPNIDPVGACVGMRGSRVQAVVSELQGEKVDIVPWSSDKATLVVNALAPAEVVKVVLDDEARRIEVVVADEQLSLAIGRRGQNVRLASLLTGWSIDITTESEESTRRTEEFRLSSELFLEALDVDEVISHLLVTEGFTQVEEVAYTPLEELVKIEGFDESVAAELIQRAQHYLEKKKQDYTTEYQGMGLDAKLLAFDTLTPEIFVALGKNGIKTLKDLADLSSDELLEILAECTMSEEDAGRIIMTARDEIDGL